MALGLLYLPLPCVPMDGKFILCNYSLCTRKQTAFIPAAGIEAPEQSCTVISASCRLFFLHTLAGVHGKVLVLCASNAPVSRLMD